MFISSRFRDSSSDIFPIFRDPTAVEAVISHFVRRFNSSFIRHHKSLPSFVLNRVVSTLARFWLLVLI